MSYLVLARKYRPQTFGEVVQQSHITQTLSHAIVADRVAHAILFTGPRGTGKTTVARILAKALNCQQGTTPNPCNQCPSCIEITNGNAADVFEIDGASNNSVDQIRELRENIPYMPSRSRYKIYIIDEVHMLSLAAFNALLKTLEEPPAHILFLFATTEPQKIPVTILSRCQRHDMRRISTSAISEHLANLCRKEQIDLPAEALTMVAREAGGSMRDALSLLDQILSCSDGTLEYEQILGLFGVIDRKVVFDLATAVLNGDMSKILDMLADIYHRGQDMRRLYGEIIDHFRNLVIVRLGHNIENLVDLPSQEVDLLREQVASVSAAALSQLFDFLFKEEQSVRFATQPKLAVEMVFFRLLQIKPTLSIDELIAKLDALRSGLPEKEPNIAARVEYKKAIPQKEPLVDSARRLHKEPPIIKKTEAQEVSAPAIDSIESKAAPIDPPPPESTAQPVSAQASKAVSEDTPDENGKSQLAEGTGSPPKADDIWQRLLAVVGKEKPSLESILAKCSLMHVKDNCLNVEINDNGYAIRIIKKNLPQLNQWCRQLSGKPMELKLVTKGEPESRKQNIRKQAAQLKNEALAHPVVLDAIEVFNGKVAEVKILSGGKEL